MKQLIVIAGLALSACGATGTAVETRLQIERVPVRARCPDKATYDRLAATQPRPLRDQPMPADADVRAAKVTAQLGRYEAKGGWADEARAALDRCQEGEDLTPTP